MGSYSLLQIVGSTIIGGLLLLMLFRYNAVVSEKNHRYNTQKVVRKNLMEVSNILNEDLNKIGFCLDENVAKTILKEPIVEATDSTIAFKTDVPVSQFNLVGDGVADVVKYYLGGPVTETPNQDDKYFYRSVNGGSPLELNYGVTKLEFTYYDENGNKLIPPIHHLENIKMIEYKITVADIYGYNYTYNIDDSEKKQGDNYFLEMSKSSKISIKNLKGR